MGQVSLPGLPRGVQRASHGRHLGWLWATLPTLLLSSLWEKTLQAKGTAFLTTIFFPLQVTVCWVDEAGAVSTHCLSPQAEHAGVRTYFFSAESPEEQEAWIQAMGEAARVQIPPAQKSVPQAVRHK